ncbi:hypothetical protein AGR3A_Lc180112 [Agrobacterium tomkonis CFBP 6623]|uniref:Uncharacterized protein n=1 Tax=Agrobacterium tomkonis CFBP 6623 TaxID=1183432 RepID=A0A1S7S2T0_9HYPH|nr:hypothetical protein AGR3A_Lc180112 [Agrobacterium tomkonis CFBP 6623]
MPGLAHYLRCRASFQSTGVTPHKRNSPAGRLHTIPVGKRIIERPQHTAIRQRRIEAGFVRHDRKIHLCEKGHRCLVRQMLNDEFYALRHIVAARAVREHRAEPLRRAIGVGQCRAGRPGDSRREIRLASYFTYPRGERGVVHWITVAEPDCRTGRVDKRTRQRGVEVQSIAGALDGEQISECGHVPFSFDIPQGSQSKEFCRNRNVRNWREVVAATSNPKRVNSYALYENRWIKSFPNSILSILKLLLVILPTLLLPT